MKYSETITIIENSIDNCETLQQEMDIRKRITNLEIQLLNDHNITPQVFSIMINRLENKINTQYNNLIQQFQ